MDAFSAIIYGIIQGITEFLPVSSSGHLAVLPHFLKIDDPGVAFDLSMHMGTALAVIIYFKNDLVVLIKELLLICRLKSFRDLNKSAYVLNLFISTLVCFIFILFIKKASEVYGRSPVLISLNLIVFGLVMWLIDRYIKSQRDNFFKTKLEWKASVFIGLMQAFAIFPGVSRSGITITAGRLFGLSRKESSRFSFLLSLPVIVGGFFFKLPELISSSETFNVVSCLIGIGVSFLTGICAIHFFISSIQKIGFWGFALYRILLALVILWAFIGN